MQTFMNKGLLDDKVTSEDMEWLKMRVITKNSEGQMQTGKDNLPAESLCSGGLEHMVDSLHESGNNSVLSEEYLIVALDEMLKNESDSAGGMETKGNQTPDTLGFREVTDAMDIDDIALVDIIGIQSTEGITPRVADFQPKSIRRHSKTAVLSLRNFYDNETPYPDDRQVFKLSDLSGLTRKQVGTWFGNERERKREMGTSSSGVTYKRKNNHPDDAINVLKAWVDKHPENMRPTTEEKTQLANEAKLTLKKVSYWFENYRKKQRKLAAELAIKNQLAYLESLPFISDSNEWN